LNFEFIQLLNACCDFRRSFGVEKVAIHRGMTEPTDVKVVLVGAASVGKTCIVKRGTTGLFDAGSQPTLGASYTSKVVDNARLLIWDTAGQERYHGITHMYYRNVVAAIIVYSIADHETFAQLDLWEASLRDNTTGNVLLFLVGNKCDLEDERQVAIDEGQSRATAMGATFCEASAKTGIGIEELFVTIATQSLEKGSLGVATTALPLEGEGGEQSDKKCC
jgi:small GTP-binding protein